MFSKHLLYQGVLFLACDQKSLKFTKNLNQGVWKHECKKLRCDWSRSSKCTHCLLANRPPPLFLGPSRISLKFLLYFFEIPAGFLSGFFQISFQTKTEALCCTKCIQPALAAHSIHLLSYLELINIIIIITAKIMVMIIIIVIITIIIVIIYTLKLFSKI